MDVSIIIPTYNRLWSLPKCVASCSSSDLAVEIIVVDDGSNDGSDEWLKSQSGIVAYRQENQGKCWAVNFGVLHARGKYIRFLDSDDWILPGSTESLFYKAEENNLDIVAAGYDLYDEQERYVSTREWINAPDFIAQQLGECDSSHYSAYLFRREFILETPHRQEYAFRDDRMFILELALKEPKVGYLEIPTLAHRIHHRAKLQKGESLQLTVANFQHLCLYKKVLGTLKLENRLTDRRISAALNILWPLAHWIAKDHLDEAIKVVDWIYELKPDFQPPEKGFLGWMHKSLGFATAEKVLSIRRKLKYGIWN